jgi:hypothetical protein
MPNHLLETGLPPVTIHAISDRRFLVTAVNFGKSKAVVHADPGAPNAMVG